ncbi:hypothetical protein BDF20DRAFT_888374 [Mycotypha africana]|uniref:uncharacterized protein n=1 Tax=Mycotypha africana TaxID=64632 RepID=UPI0023007E08|nr:uncharacterized protein BDF20DRAFT_888374 [Mycotypha africana]KAI8969904.1 hypothetical protein BDF20DRAFT_888374 [Mycotypha africana]
MIQSQHSRHFPSFDRHSFDSSPSTAFNKDTNPLRQPPIQRQWSIRQANSRLAPHGLEAALEHDLSKKLEIDEKIVQGLAIPLDELNSPSDNFYQYVSANNDDQSNSQFYLSGTPMIQQPSRTHIFRNSRQKVYGYSDPFAVAPKEAWQEIRDYNLRVNGIPTLDQMMRLHTFTPLTQSNFATFLRRRNVHQNLNFLMELETHNKLWKAYIQSVDRQNRQRLSRFLESAAEKENFTNSEKDQHHYLPQSVTVMSSGASYVETPETDDLLTPLPPHPLTSRTSSDDTYASRGNKSLTHHDLVQNATRIYRTYCSPLMDAAQTIHLPDDHRRALEELIEINERPEPAVFKSAKTHVYEVLNVFYYPLFVDAILHKNISPGCTRLCLMLGILTLTVALSLELSFIFLDVGSRYAIRWIPIVSFLAGWSFLLSSLTEFAWWLGIFCIRESQLFVISEIQDITVKKLHRKRGWIWLGFTIALSLISTLIFVFIPSHHL